MTALSGGSDMPPKAENTNIILTEIPSFTVVDQFFEMYVYHEATMKKIIA